MKEITIKKTCRVRLKDILEIVQHKIGALLKFSVRKMGGNRNDFKQTGITLGKGKKEALRGEDDLPFHSLERTGFHSKNF